MLYKDNIESYENIATNTGRTNTFYGQFTYYINIVNRLSLCIPESFSLCIIHDINYNIKLVIPFK